mgnify:CR=1 FL=1
MAVVALSTAVVRAAVHFAVATTTASRSPRSARHCHTDENDDSDEGYDR